MGETKDQLASSSKPAERLLTKFRLYSAAHWRCVKFVTRAGIGNGYAIYMAHGFAAITFIACCAPAIVCFLLDILLKQA